MQDVNWIALGVFVALFGFITWLGFAAAHWRKGDPMAGTIMIDASALECTVISSKTTTVTKR